MRQKDGTASRPVSIFSTNKKEEKKQVLNFSAAKDLFAQMGKIQQRSKEVPLFSFSHLPWFLDFTF